MATKTTTKPVQVDAQATATPTTDVVTNTPQTERVTPKPQLGDDALFEKTYHTLMNQKVLLDQTTTQLKTTYNAQISTLDQTTATKGQTLAKADRDLSGEFLAKANALKTAFATTLDNLKKALAQATTKRQADSQNLASQTTAKLNALVEKSQSALAALDVAIQQANNQLQAANKTLDANKQVIYTTYSNDLSQLEAAEKALKDKLTADIATLEKTYQASIKTAEANSKKVVDALLTGIENETAHYNQQKALLTADHQTVLANFDSQSQKALALFDDALAQKQSIYQNPLNEKTKRLESLKDTDPKAASLLQKDILNLTRELQAAVKTITSEKTAKASELSAQRVALIKGQITQLSNLEKDLLSFKAKQDYLIAVETQTLASTKTRLDLVLQQGINARQQNFEQEATTLLKQKITLAETRDKALEMASLGFDMNAENLALEKALLDIQKGQANVQLEHQKEGLQMDQSTALGHIDFDFEVSEQKLKNDEQLQSLLHQFQLNELRLQEVISYFDHDRQRQQSLNDDVTQQQSHLTQLAQAKWAELGVYDEAEIRHRYTTKIAIFKQALSLLEQDKEATLARLQQTYAKEGQLYQTKIDEIAAPILAKIATVKKTSEALMATKQAELAKLEVNEANAPAIKALQKELAQLTTQKDREVEQLDNQIKTATATFTLALKQSQARLTIALTNATQYVTTQQLQLNRSIDLLNQEMAQELASKSTYLQTVQTASTQLQALTTQLMTEASTQNQAYFQTRSATTQAELTAAKTAYDKAKAELETNLSKALQGIEMKRKQHVADGQLKVTKSQQVLASKLATIDLSVVQAKQASANRSSLRNSQSIITLSQFTALAVKNERELVQKNALTIKELGVKASALIHQLTVNDSALVKTLHGLKIAHQVSEAKFLKDTAKKLADALRNV